MSNSGSRVFSDVTLTVNQLVYNLKVAIFIVIYNVLYHLQTHQYTFSERPQLFYHIAERIIQIHGQKM